MKKIIFIINPKCMYFNRFKKNLVAQHLPDDEYDVEFLTSEYDGHGIILTRQAIKNNPDIIVAVGGNATINQVAAELIDTDIALGVIPMTMGTGIARYLNISLAPLEALEVIKNNKTIKMDIGQVINNTNTYHFVNNITTGISAEIAHRVGDNPKKHFREYMLALFPLLMNYKRSRKLTVKFNGFNAYDSFSELFIGNINMWGGPLKPLMRHNSIEDGILDICIGADVSKARLLTYLMRYFFFLSDELLDESDIYKSSHVYIKTDKPTKFQIDFIPITLNGTIEIELLHKALKIIVPSTYKE